MTEQERRELENLREEHRKQQADKKFRLQDHGKPGTKDQNVRYYRDKSGQLKSYKYKPKPKENIDSRSHKNSGKTVGKAALPLSSPVAYQWLKNEGFLPEKLADLPDLPGELKLWVVVIGLLLAGLYAINLGIKYYEEY